MKKPLLLFTLACAIATGCRVAHPTGPRSTSLNPLAVADTEPVMPRALPVLPEAPVEFPLLPPLPGSPMLLEAVTVPQSLGPTLTIGVTNVVDEAVIDQAGHFPNQIMPAEGGTNFVNIKCISGLAFTLTVNSTTNVFIEYSTNLINWGAYPSVGFQLTMSAASSPYFNEMTPMMFFRTRDTVSTNAP